MPHSLPPALPNWDTGTGNGLCTQKPLLLVWIWWLDPGLHQPPWGRPFSRCFSITRVPPSRRSHLWLCSPRQVQGLEEGRRGSRELLQPPHCAQMPVLLRRPLSQGRQDAAAPSAKGDAGRGDAAGRAPGCASTGKGRALPWQGRWTCSCLSRVRPRGIFFPPFLPKPSKWWGPGC